jgi:hypothetical protein
MRMQTAMIHRARWAGLALGLACGAGPGGASGSSGPGTATAARPAIQPGDLVIANAAVVPMSQDGELAHH